MGKKLTREEFIIKAREVHGDKYDYSKVEYVNGRTKVCIICPEHGEFWQTPSNHLNGCVCPKCSTQTIANKNRFSDEEFIKKAKEVHGSKYDYSKVKYVDCDTKVCIICPQHGEFMQRPASHLRGQGCPRCISSFKSDRQGFINKARQVHGDKYDYSKVEYFNSKVKVCIICPEHGEFMQRPNNHLDGQGCPHCGEKYKQTGNIQKRKASRIFFIEKSQKIHGGKYDYSKTVYVDAKTKVCITCPIHGDFFVRPADHIYLKSGCPKCNSSHLENEIRVLLLKNDIKFIEQQKFEWMGQLRLDFYLPEHNIAIECQGKQHFEPIGYFGSYDDFQQTQERDKRKQQLCEEHGIKIMYCANYEYDFPYEVITDNNILIERIKECVLTE